MPCQMTLNQFLLSVRLGWPSEERAKHQLVAVDITLTFKTPPLACQTDLLTDTICYHGLTEALKTGVSETNYRLIECLALALYQLTRNFLPPDMGVHVRVTKKPAIPDLTEGVSFTYGDPE